MKCNSDKNPLLVLADFISIELRNYIKKDFSSYKPIESILKLILLNNGCMFSNDAKMVQYNDLKIGLIFITGAIGNSANEYYDYITLNDSKFIVIFLDYFDGIITEDRNFDESNVSDNMDAIMGNSVYYDVICNIVQLYNNITMPEMNIGLYGATSAARTLLWSKYLIAASILDDIKPIDENDIASPSLESVYKMLENGLQLALSGIFVLNDQNDSNTPVEDFKEGVVDENNGQGD